MPVLRITRFTSLENGHRHLLKHVLRLTEVEPDERKTALDPEDWSNLVPSPPLEPNADRRRQKALAALREAAGCPAGVEGVTGGQPCVTCRNRSAVASVEERLGPLLREYERVAREALAWAFRTAGPQGPRALAYHGKEGLAIETWSDERVRFIGALDVTTGEVRTITCFRDRSRSYKDRYLALQRERAGHKTRGTLVPLDGFTVE
jgi:hypothetical protein